MNDKIKNSQSISVADFRLILQWPLLLDQSVSSGGQSIRETILKERDRLDSDDCPDWQRVSDRPRYPWLSHEGKKSDADALAYSQTVYFHDFVRDFLFDEKTSKDELALFERTDIAKLRARLEDDGPAYVFAVDRASLHLFSIGVAIFSLELRWTNNEGPKPNDISLADCQTLIDRLRRSFAPYLTHDKHDKKDENARHRGPDRADGVPAEISLFDAAGNPIDRCEPADAKSALEAVRKKKPIRTWQACFDHWATLIKPLSLTSRGGQWRDPADERIPVNSFIRLKTGPGENAEQAALLAIGEEDWYRLAEADGAGSGHPYNKRFMRQREDNYYYDRFFPSTGCAICATRHIFGPSHYCVVSAGDFGRDFLLSHFRRHYAQMGLILRLEQAVLLSISRRLSRATAGLPYKDDENDFENTVIEIHRDFLNFCHRFRFTGVSNQIQPTEMLDKWRCSIGLDRLFADIEAELAAAFQRVTALQQKREAEASVDLSRLAAAAALLGLVAATATTDIADILPWRSPLPRIAGIGGFFLIALPALSLFFGIRSRPLRLRLMWSTFAGLILMTLACLAMPTG